MTAPEASPIGRATMSSGMQTALRYHRYVYDAVRSQLGTRVWEIGCGFGQYTRFLLAEGKTVLASDIAEEMLVGVKDLEGPLTVARVDLTHPESIAQAKPFAADSILCLNVLEHIEDDVEALRAIRAAVAPRCRAAFLVPAHLALYGFMDRAAGHFRRYSRGTLERSFTLSGWTVHQSFYVNPIGAVGWLVRNRIAPPTSSDLDDPVVNRDIERFERYGLPLTRVVQPFTRKLFGQSVVVFAENV